MQASTLPKTILFSDIVGSSKLYQELGNERAEAKIHFAIQTLRACTQKHSGSVIKTIGDEIMCAFDLLSDAVDCAAEMNTLVIDDGIELRTGISSGQLIERGGDFFGDVVNDAAFLTKTARAREILIDELALDSGNMPASKKIELIAEMTIKGKDSACKIYRLNWESTLNHTLSATQVNNPSQSKSAAQKSLSLVIRDQFVTIDRKHPIAIIGREKPKVGLQIKHGKISRRHCTIELKQGKFVLQDHSTNGTYVAQDQSEITPVHRESFALLGSGELRLGNENADENCIIRYAIQ